MTKEKYDYEETTDDEEQENCNVPQKEYECSIEIIYSGAIGHTILKDMIDEKLQIIIDRQSFEKRETPELCIYNSFSYCNKPSLTYESDSELCITISKDYVPTLMRILNEIQTDIDKLIKFKWTIKREIV